MIDITNYISSIVKESACSVLDGWIFSNFSHHDSLTDELLHLTNTISTRRWIYIIFKNTPPLKILHEIEPHVLDNLPGNRKTYCSLEEMLKLLKIFQGKTFAILSDSSIAEISTMDAGFAQILSNCKIKTRSAAPLIQRSKGVLTKAGIFSHERAATLLYTIIQRTWDYVCESYIKNKSLYERDLQQFIMHCFSEYNLVTDYPPIVAFGKNTNNPHYEISEKNNAKINRGDIIQFDIWAKEAFAADMKGNISSDTPIYADISWVGVFEKAPSKIQTKDFNNLKKARDFVYDTLLTKTKDNKLFEVTGQEIDQLVRNILIKNGYQKNIKHRTGHGIDVNCHGSGVNIDSIEFPDNRTLLEGSCFSIEPGIYGKNYGMRTEINIYIENAIPIISGMKFQKNMQLKIPQKEILTIS